MRATNRLGEGVVAVGMKWIEKKRRGAVEKAHARAVGAAFRENRGGDGVGCERSNE